MGNSLYEYSARNECCTNDNKIATDGEKPLADGLFVHAGIEFSYHGTLPRGTTEMATILGQQSLAFALASETSLDIVKATSDPKEMAKLDAKLQKSIDEGLRSFGVTVDDAHYTHIGVSEEFYRDVQEAKHKIVIDALADRLKGK